MKHILPFSLLVTFTLLIAVSSAAATYTSTQSGDWNDVDTWGGGGFPGASDIAVITGGFTVTVTENEAALEVNVHNSVSLGAASELVVNSGTKLTVTDSLVVLADGTADTNPVVDNNGTVEIGADLILKVLNGVFSFPEFKNGDTLSLSGDLVLNAGHIAPALCKLNNDAATSVFNFSGSVTTANQGGQILSNTGGAKAVFNKGSSQSLPVSSSNYKYHDISVENGTTLTLPSDISQTTVLGGTITVASGCELDLNGNDFTTTTFEGLIINSGATLTIPTSSICPPSGRFTTLTLDGTVEYTASSASIESDHDYVNLTVSGGGTATFDGATTVTGTLTLSGSTTLSSSGNLTLASDASNSAHVATIPGGSSITGDVIVQRWISTIESKNAQWHMLGSPISDATIQNDLNDDMTTSGFPNSEISSLDFVSVKSYNTAASAWADPGDVSDSWDNAQTFAVYLGNQDGNRALDFEGPINSGDQELTLSNSGTAFNLIGNPYPAYVSIDNLLTSGLSNVSTTGYLLTDAGGYVAKDDNDGAHLAPGEGMWVLATGGSPTVTFAESYKEAPGSETYRTYSKTSAQPRQEFNVQLIMPDVEVNGSAYVDGDLEVTMMDQATEAYDNVIDAPKLHHPSFYPGLVAVSSDDVSLTKDRIPAQEEITVPLRVEWPMAGESYILEFTNIEQMVTGGNCLVFEDQNAGVSFPLTKDTTYTFISDPELVEYDIEAWNANGQYLPGDTISGLFIHISKGMSTNALVTTCAGSNDGAAIAVPLDNQAYDIIWKDLEGNTLKSSTDIIGADTLTGVGSGSYLAEINGTGCLSNMDLTVFVDQPDAVVAAFNTSSTGNQVEVGEEITFTNQSVNAMAYSWDFGDENSSIEPSPIHSYTEEGTYTVSLTAVDGDCFAEITEQIEVVPAVVTNISQNDRSIEVLTNNSVTTLRTSDASLIEFGYVVNSLGQLIDVNYQITNGQISIDHPRGAGMYRAVISINGERHVQQMLVR